MRIDARYGHLQEKVCNRGQARKRSRHRDTDACRAGRTWWKQPDFHFVTETKQLASLRNRFSEHLSFSRAIRKVLALHKRFKTESNNECMTQQCKCPEPAAHDNTQWKASMCTAGNIKRTSGSRGRGRRAEREWGWCCNTVYRYQRYQTNHEAGTTKLQTVQNELKCDKRLHNDT
jgi:hypothetical protein